MSKNVLSELLDVNVRESASYPRSIFSFLWIESRCVFQNDSHSKGFTSSIYFIFLQIVSQGEFCANVICCEDKHHWKKEKSRVFYNQSASRKQKISFAEHVSSSGRRHFTRLLLSPQDDLQKQKKALCGQFRQCAIADECLQLHISN